MTGLVRDEERCRPAATLGRRPLAANSMRREQFDPAYPHPALPGQGSALAKPS